MGGWMGSNVRLPRTGAPERDLIFTTEHSQGKSAVWILLEYDPATHAVEYIYIVPETVVCRIRVSCEADGAGASRARVAYLMTGLSPAGNERVDHLSHKAFAARMAEWERRIEEFLNRGAAGNQ